MSPGHTPSVPPPLPDFVLTSRLEFIVADFDGNGPRDAWVLEHAPGSGTIRDGLWRVRVAPPIHFACESAKEEVVLQARHARYGLGRMLAEWKQADPSERLPSAADPCRWVVDVHVVPIREDAGSLLDRLDRGLATWGEVVPAIDLVPPHTAKATGPEVDLISRLELWVRQEGSLPGESAPAEFRSSVSFLLDLYCATINPLVGRVRLGPSDMKRLEALPGWQERVEARGRAPQDPRVTALARFARREGHCRVPPGHVEEGIRLDLELPRLTFGWLTMGAVSENDRAVLSGLPGWREALRLYR
jgi:hypothetical protein